MHLRDDTLGLPFSLTSGEGLGILNSSCSQLHSFLPTRPFGQANVQCVANMATGNLYCQDHLLSFPDVGGPVEFFYAYNSNNNQSHLAYGSRLQAIKEKDSISVVASDGQITQCLYNTNSNNYVAQKGEKDLPVLTFDQNNDQWICYHPESRLHEIFSSEGLLIEKIDEAGNQTHFEYDELNKLKAIIPPSGVRYEFEQIQNKIEIYLNQQQQQQRILLHSYTLNNDGQLLKSQTADGYEINYHYNQNKQLQLITQTDHSELNFSYHENGLNKNKLKRIRIGQNPSDAYEFQFEDKQTVFTDPAGAKAILTYNDKKQPTEFLFNNNKSNFKFTTAYQVEELTYPDGSQEKFEYDEQSGLISKHIFRDGTFTTYSYSSNEKPLLLAKTHLAKESSASQVSRFVYDTRFKEDHAVLRYKISPKGKVIAYTVNKQGLVEFEKVFSNDFYSDESTHPTLSEMESWSIGKSHSLKQFQYDQLGRVKTITVFVEVNVKSDKKNSDTFETETTYDARGRIKKQLIKTADNCYLQIDIEPDDLGRILKKTQGGNTKIKQTTTYEYQNNHITMIHPNKRQDIKVLNSKGIVEEEKSLVKKEKVNESRVTQYQHYEKGRVAIRTNPNKKQSYEFYDEEQRLATSVSVTGKVTTYTYNKKYRYEVKTQYANSINVTSIYPTQSLLFYYFGANKVIPDEQLLNNAIQQNDEHDRKFYTFYNVKDKPVFTLDAENYLTAYQYDSFGRLLQTIVYQNKVTQDELNLLLEGKEVARTPNRKYDRINSIFYDKDNNKIAEVDPSGYAIEYIRDAAGRITEEIHFATPTLTIGTDFDQLRPVKIPKQDAHQFHFYNAENQNILSVDAEGYITTKTYFADGKLKTLKRFANKINSNWYQDTKTFPILIEHHNDKEENYTYDELGRLIKIRISSGKVEHYQYDEMNHQIVSSSDDEYKIKKSGDHQRKEESQFDAWEQQVSHANEFVTHSRELDGNLQDQNSRFQYDETGLKISSIDSYGNTTWYYYDDERRLATIVDPTGAVIETIYNNFDEIEIERKYYQRLSQESLKTLKGGYIDDSIKSLIKTHEKDRIIFYDYDRRGLISKTIDAEGYVSTFEYDAFKNCSVEHLPVNQKSPTLMVEHQYDMRGLEIKSTHSDGQTTITTEKAYNHYLGGETDVYDAALGHTRFSRDKLGRVTEIKQLQEDKQYLTITVKEYDAFNRVVKTTDANGSIETVDYHEVDRTRHITHAEGGNTKIKMNVFDEEVELIRLDQKGKTLCHEAFIHAPNGAILSSTNGLGNTKSISYDLLGRKEEEIQENGAIKKYSYNASGQITKIVQDADENGLNLTTQFEPNAFGDHEKITDPRGVVSANEYDRRGNLIKSIHDIGPNKLNLVNSYLVNAKGDKIEVLTGDIKEGNQHHIQYKRDDFNRVTDKILNPEQLQIKTEVKHDKAGNIIQEIDPNGNPSYFIYNSLQQKRFSLIKVGKEQYKIKEWNYTKTGKVKSVREYSLPLVKNNLNQISLGEIKESVVKSNNDVVTLFFYDKEDRERFTLKLLSEKSGFKAIVEEKINDVAGREIKRINYANYLEIGNLEELTTDALQDKVTSIRQAEKDRVTYHSYDIASQQIYTLDQDGSILEKKYNSSGQVIAEIQYGKTIEFPDQILLLSKDEVEKLLVPYSNGSLTTYFVYDALGREIYNITPDGAVVGKEYDDNNNMTQVCHFKDWLIDRGSYDEMIKSLNNLKPDPKKDRITKTQYNHANHVESVTDPLGFTDFYQRNALGSLLQHTDRNGQVWENRFDAAQRLVEEISPETKVVVVKENGEGARLTHQEIKIKVIKKTDYDAVGNTISITEADGINKLTQDAEKPRVFNVEYNYNNQVIGTKVEDVTVVKPHEDTQFDKVVTTTIKTKIIYNLHGKKIAECNESGIWDFYIYDSLGRLTYEIKKESAVIYYEYNSFSQVIEEYRYANPIKIDINKYQDISNFNENVSELQLLPRSVNDRVKHYSYYPSGKVKSIKSNPILYYVDGKTGVEEPETMFAYNKFGDCIYQSRLISPNNFAEKFRWFDAGKLIFEVDENKYVTYYEWNAEDKLTKKIEYNESLETVSTALSVSELKDKIKISPDKDRIYTYEYNQRGDKIAERLYHVTAYQSNNSKPELMEEEHEFVETKYQYTPCQKVTKVINEDNTEENLFYDERGIKIAETGITRSGKDENENNVQITPIISYKPNIFGQVVVEQTSPQGAKLNNSSIIPQVSDETIIYEKIKLIDNRGLIKVKQDGEGNQVAYTYTPTKRIAAKTQKVSSWVTAKPTPKLFTFASDTKMTNENPIEDSFVIISRNENLEEDWELVNINHSKTLGVNNGYYKESHLDHIKYSYDQFEQPISIQIFQDNQLEEATYSHYNIFGEFIGEGSEENKIEAYRKLDAVGKPWFSNNENGSYNFHLRDLLGNETLRIQSANVDLSKIELNDIPQLLQVKDELDLHEMQRDQQGKLIARRAPIWWRDPINCPYPTNRYQYDRWGNIVKEWDSKNHERDMEYDNRDLLIKEAKSPISNLQDDNTEKLNSAVTKFAYTVRGIKVGIVNAKGHTSTQILDEASNVIGNILADGTIEEKRILDTLNRPIKIYDARNKKYTYQYNSNHDVISYAYPSGRIYFYDYDEKGNRSLIISPSKSEYRFNYDARNNCVQRFTHVGHSTQMSYDRNRQQLTVQVPMQNLLSWERDWFGHPLKHRDLGLREYAYEYNLNKQLTHKSSLDGNARESIYIQPGEIFHNSVVNSYVATHKTQVPVQDISYDYQYGFLKEVKDHGIDRKTSYEYDADGRRQQLSIKELSKDRLLQIVETDYDDWGREKETRDQRVVINGVFAKTFITTKYDVADNRRYRKIILHPPRFSDQCSDPVQSYEDWNTYDVVDRAIIIGGKLNRDNNKVEVDSLNSTQFTYEHNKRSQETTGDANHPITTSITYNADNLLDTTTSSTGVLTKRNYHVGGWIENYKETYPDGHYIERVLQCDENEWPVHEYLYDDQAAAHMWNKLYSETVYENLPSGFPQRIETHINVPRNYTLDALNVTYTGGESYQIESVSGQRSNRYGKSGFSIGNFWYDNNNAIRAKINSEDEPNETLAKQQSAVKNMQDFLMRLPVEERRNYLKLIYEWGTQLTYFDTTTDGRILSKQFMIWNEQYGFALPFQSYQLIYNVNGVAHGCYCTNLDSTPLAFLDYGHHSFNAEVADVLPQTVLTRYDYIRPIAMDHKHDSNPKNNPLGEEYLNYRPFSYLQVYMVNSGDTFESIAEKMFGDGFYGYHIAKNNGFIINKTLAAGQILFLPQIIPNHNKAHNTRPYHELVNLLTGRLIPHLETPMPKEQDDRNGFLGALIKIIAIAIIITVAPMLATTLFSFGTVGMTVATGAIAGLMDAAQQGLVIGMGFQSKFSWNEMFEVAVSAAALPHINLAHEHTLRVLTENIVKIGTVQVGTQFTEMALGLRDKLNVEDIAMQISSALVGQEINEHLGSLFDKTRTFERNATVNTATTVTNSLLGSAVTHTPINVQNMAAQAIGDTVGDKIGEKVSEQFRPKDNQRKNTGLSECELEEIETLSHAQINQPVLKTGTHYYGDENYHLSEINRTRMQRWNSTSSRSKPIREGWFMREVDDFNSTVEKYIAPAAGVVMAATGVILFAPEVLAVGNAFGSASLAAFGVPIESMSALESTVLGGTTVLHGGIKNIVRSLSRFGVFSREVGSTKSAIQIATKHPLEGLSPENVVRLVDELGLETPKDQLILWSGLGRDGEGIKLSQEYAYANGGITLEMTKGGSWLNEMNLFGANSPFSFKEAIQIWNRVSIKMIQQCSGQVRSLIGQVKPTSIYRAEQSEILTNNKITGLDELYLRPRVLFGKY